MFHAGMSLVLAAAALLGGLQAAGAFAHPATGLNTGRLGAVVLVPGYGGNTGSLDVLADRIRALGRTAVLVRLPGQGTGDLQAQATVLNQYVVRELHALAAPVDIIGYSAGGVVARLWDMQYHGAQKARRIITLGAPLHGTRLASAGNAIAPGACPAACQELIPGSTLMTTLRKAPLTSRPAWLSLWSGDDQVVRPPTSSALPGAVNVPLQSVCPTAVIQHSQLPSDPLVIGIVLRSIASAPLSVPRVWDCASLQALGTAGPLGFRP